MSRFAAAADDGPSAAEVSTRRLLDALDEKKLPDVTLWVLDRVESDPDVSAELKKEVPFRRATALVGTTRLESDSKKRADILTNAEKEIDRFLQDSPSGEQAIAAFTQKGNLLIERGRAKVEQAKRAGADAPKVLAEALPFFDSAIKSLEGPVRKKDEEIETVTNAEDAVLKELRAVDKELAALQGAAGKQEEAAGKKPKKPVRRPPGDMKKIERLEERQDALRGQLLQTRLLVGGAYFEKSRALPPGSPEWKKTIEASAANYKELYEKYRTRGVGLFARYYEGRNYATLALAEEKPDDRKKMLDKALSALADIRMLDGEAGFVPGLRAKAINSSLECWLDAKAYADKEFKDFDERLLKIAMAKLTADRLDADWLGLKYRSALMLERRADAVPDAVRGKSMLQNAKKLALEVAKFNKDYAAEARALLEQLGKSLPDDGTGGEESFEASMDAARLALQNMQSKQAEMKQFAAGGKAAEAQESQKAAAAERDKALVALRKAIPLATEEEIDALNQARYMLTFLNYDARRLHDAAALGTFLAERYPNSRGSRQAAKIAMASWQMLSSKEGPVEWRGAAKNSCAEVAGLILRTWPEEAESADAAVIAIASATESRNPEQLIRILGMVPQSSPRRGEVLLRGGPALWREVLDKRRLEEGVRPADDVLAEWKQKATQAIDDGLATIPAGTKPDKTTVAAVISRCQIAIEDGNNDLVMQLLEQPDYGPWTVVNGQDPAFTEGPLAENTLSLALRYFIQTEKLDKAQQAMDRLEAVAGTGEEASAKLTAMYLAMGRDLQAQLDELGSGDKAGTPEAQSKAKVILGGFEKFLDGVGKRDQKISSQMWVATTYLSLGSGSGTGSVVPKDQAEGYLAKAAEFYEKLLKQGGDQITKFEPSIRLKMANVYRELGKWDDAQGHIDWLLSDAKRQNSLDTQIQAAELLQTAGEKASDKAKAEQYFKQAIVGRKEGGSVIWGWGGISNKLARQAFGGSDEKSLDARAKFFTARLNVAKCRLARAGVSETDRDKLLQMAANDVAITYKLYPELGGPSMYKQFDKLLKEIEKERGNSSTKGLADLKEAQQAAEAGGGS